MNSYVVRPERAVSAGTALSYKLFPHQSDSGSISIVDTIKEGYKRTNEYTTGRLKEKKNTQTQKRNLEEQKHRKPVRGEQNVTPSQYAQAKKQVAV